MRSSWSKIAVGFVMLLGALPLSEAKSAHIAAKPACQDVEIVVKGRINSNDAIKSGDFGFHHCVHKKLKSKDFPRVSPQNPKCRQIDVEPEVVAINPPLPHEINADVSVYGHPNPFYISNGTDCEVKYVQYYFRP